MARGKKKTRATPISRAAAKDVRGRIERALLAAEPQTADEVRLSARLPITRQQVRNSLARLIKHGSVVQVNGHPAPGKPQEYRLTDERRQELMLRTTARPEPARPQLPAPPPMAVLTHGLSPATAQLCVEVLETTRETIANWLAENDLEIPRAVEETLSQRCEDLQNAIDALK